MFSIQKRILEEVFFNYPLNRVFQYMNNKYNMYIAVTTYRSNRFNEATLKGHTLTQMFL